MQIVIKIHDIPQNDHERWVLKNGTPLPKCHGRLIAEPTEEDIAKTVGGQNGFAECIRDAVKTVFDNAPTIIEGSDSK